MGFFCRRRCCCAIDVVVVVVVMMMFGEPENYFKCFECHCVLVPHTIAYKHQKLYRMTFKKLFNFMNDNFIPKKKISVIPPPKKTSTFSLTGNFVLKNFKF